MGDEQKALCDAARKAVDGLRAVLQPGAEKPNVKAKTFLDSRPKWWHVYSFHDLPGLTRTHAGSMRSPNVSVTYQHELLPGWDYLGRELREMLEDLDNLAEGKGPPKEATR